MTQTAEAAVCRYCHQWEPAAGDTYCGFCGRLQLLLEVEPSTLVLISGIAASKELVLRNAGARPMHVAIAPRNGASIAAVSFDGTEPRLVPGNGEIRVRASVDAEKLPQGFHRILEYVCTVDGDAQKCLPFQIDVRSGPAPRLVPPALDFHDVEEGKTVERSVVLTNAGSVTLGIASIRAEGSPHLKVQEEHAGRVVEQGQKLTIPVIWQPSNQTAATPDVASGIRFAFTNYAESLFVPVTARMFRYRLEPKPTAVRIRQALAKRDYTTAIRLENNGTTDVEVTAIESDQPWIKVVARAAAFTLLCAESAGQKPLSPTTFARAIDFKIVCHPEQLAEGKHRGLVTIRPQGQEPLALAVELSIVTPREYADYIGIDFGTTNSVVAVLGQKPGTIELVKDEVSGKDLIPSVLVFDDPDSYKIGEAARNEADTAPDRTVRSIKRVMGYERDRSFFDRSYSAGELASLIIRKLVQLAEHKLHTDSPNGAHYNVRKAIITVPANFHDLQIRDVLEACEAAGLDTEEAKARRSEDKHRQDGSSVNAGIILDEPSAAVLYYIDFLRRTRSAAEITQAIARERGLTLLVFDYGGGTLDVSVANVTQMKSGGTGLRILANMGDNSIGGDHIDVLVMRELLRRSRQEVSKFDFDVSLVTGTFKELERRCENEGWNSDVWRDLLRVRAQWKDLGERVKIRIAERKQNPVDVTPDLIVRINGRMLEKAPRGAKIQPLSNEVVNNLLQPVLAKCTELVTASLALAGVEPEHVDYILHTGRQSLLPQVRSSVRAVFPRLANDRDLLEEEHLKICVAKGAALYGSMRDRLGGRDTRIFLLSEGRRLPHSYGVETYADLVEPEFDEVIARGESYPVERTKPYPAEMIPPSGYLNLKFYQNTGTAKAIVGNPQISLIGHISIDTAGREGCDVTFSVGANRTLHVFANGEPVTIEPARLHEEESWLG